MKKQKYLINKYQCSNNFYRKINFYNAWIVRRLIVQGFKVYFFSNAIRNIYLKMSTNDFCIYVDASIYEIKSMFKTYIYKNHQTLIIPFDNYHFSKIHCLSEAPYNTNTQIIAYSFSKKKMFF